MKILMWFPEAKKWSDDWFMIVSVLKDTRLSIWQLSAFSDEKAAVLMTFLTSV